jgi:hypothetical protein
VLGSWGALTYIYNFIDHEEEYPLHDPVVQELERLKWFLWHGNVYQALQVVEPVRKLLNAVRVDFIDLWSSSWINGVLRCGSARYRPDPACAAK